MALRVKTTFEITGDRTLIERASKNLRNTRKFLKQVGVLGLTSADHRLEQILALRPQNEAVRSGHLAKSLAPGQPGNIFRLNNFSVTVGSNLGYAAQLQYGGKIEPKPPRKALAIPVNLLLKKGQISPSVLDPNREKLTFRPFRSKGKKNVIGGLFDFGESDEAFAARKATNKRARKKKSATGFVKGKDVGPLLYVLVTSVTQQGKPYLFWSDDDMRVVREELFVEWVRE